SAADRSVSALKVLIVPGWHENVDDVRVFADGRNGHEGLKARGFDCEVITEGHGGLTGRIEHFARYLDDLKVREPGAFPIASLGYSAGGLINRGFLRAHPERANELASVFQVATPNGGIVSEFMALTMHALRMPSQAIADMDVRSPFMAWLNQSDGHLEPVPGTRRHRWRFDREPVIAPPGTRIHNVAGRLPGKQDGDGVVALESADLDGRVEGVVIEAPTATHLNLSGAWNAFTLVFRGWRGNDELWPKVVERAAGFFRRRSGAIR
ncbi:MAG: hypothetical protein ABI346_10205, partial [Candidatus Baltobacteraceae bacterium]